MTKHHVTWTIPLAVLAVAGATVGLSLHSAGRYAATGSALRVPDRDNSKTAKAPAGFDFREGKFEKLAGQPLAAPEPYSTGAWPCFRGVNRDGISTDSTKLIRSFPAAGPKVLWSTTAGEGHAGPVILDGRVFLLDHDGKERRDIVRCLSLADGKDIWRYSYPVMVKGPHGQSRTVPAVTDRHLVTFGPRCQVHCFDPATGQLKWAIDLVKEFGATVPAWHAGQCPLIDGDRLILGVGGPQLVMALELETGKVMWKSPNPLEWKMTHVSLVPMNLDGRRTYVYAGDGGVAAVDAADGQIVWLTEAWQVKTATVPTPVACPDNRVFLSGGYGAGSRMIRIVKTGDAWEARVLFSLEPDQFGAEQHTPILYKDHLFGVRPDGMLTCLDLDGKIKWTSKPGKSFGISPFMIADGLILLMDDLGSLTLVEATPAAFKELAEAKVLPGPDAWGPMALAGGRLIVRDVKKMSCLWMGP